MVRLHHIALPSSLAGPARLARQAVASITIAWALAPSTARLRAQAPPVADPAEARAAREAINEGNRRWGRVRTTYDRAQAERMLAPEFYAQIRDQRISRDEFIGQVSTPGGARISRFDASVLTVRKTTEGWVALIQEKIEISGQRRDGTPFTVYSYWITRDGWKNMNGEWLITSSETVDMENFREQRPPMADW